MRKLPNLHQPESQRVATEVSNIQVLIGDKFPTHVIPIIEKARYSIDILVFDWRWYPSDPHSPVQLFNQSILRAVRRGVVVRCLANHLDIVDLLNKNGVLARKVTTSTLIHSKLMIVDCNISILGSHNYTASAFSKNYESSVAITSPDVANQFGSYFDVLFEHYGYNIPRAKV